MAINDFLSNFKNGLRANRFRVSIDGIDNKLQFLCRSTSIPESTISPVDIPFMGHTFSVPGDRQGGRIWTTEIMADTDLKVRKELELWQELIRPQELPGGVDIVGAIRTATVDLLNTNEEIVRSYRMLKCWPTTIGEVPLSHDSVDTIITYTCDFAFFSWTTLF